MQLTESTLGHLVGNGNKIMNISSNLMKLGCGIFMLDAVVKTLADNFDVAAIACGDCVTTASNINTTAAAQQQQQQQQQQNTNLTIQ